MMKNKVSTFFCGAKFCSTVLLTGSLLITQSAMAAECRLSIVLDRTGSMGSGADPLSKCSVARDFTIGVIQGFINGDDVSVIPDPNMPVDLTNPLIDPGFYNVACPLLSERQVEIITISEATDFPSAPVSYTSGFVAPAVALAQLASLEATDNAGTSTCSGGTQLSDSLCVAADSLRAEASIFAQLRRMKIVTDGGENASSSAPATVCEDPVESIWIQNTSNHLLFGGLPIQYDAILFTNLFASSAAPNGGGNPGDEVSGSGKLSTAEQNFLGSLAINTGGSVNLLTGPADVAGTFTSPSGGGVDLCGSDFDMDFDVDNLDALRFSQDFNNPSCQISP